jgi:hypothetical protein
MIRVIVQEKPVEVEEWVWKISTQPPNIKCIELEEESFLSTIMEVANA